VSAVLCSSDADDDEGCALLVLVLVLLVVEVVLVVLVVLVVEGIIPTVPPIPPFPPVPTVPTVPTPTELCRLSTDCATTELSAASLDESRCNWERALLVALAL
jgi:hypothetical protein